MPIVAPPSIKFNSVVVIVAPSSISNCASVTVAEPIIRFPPIVVFAAKVKLPEPSPEIQVVVVEPS